jgi:hypothetical protein
MLAKATDPEGALRPLRPKSSDPDQTWFDPITLLEDLPEASQ